MQPADLSAGAAVARLQLKGACTLRGPGAGRNYNRRSRCSRRKDLVQVGQQLVGPHSAQPMRMQQLLHILSPATPDRMLIKSACQTILHAAEEHSPHR